MNKNSKKFRRDLQHHIQKHLIKDLEKCCGYELNFGKGEVVETDNKVTWKFKDETDHGFSKEEEDMYDRHWRLNWMFLVQMNQLWLMLNINPFQCKQYVVTVAAGAFTRLVRKSFYFNYVAMSVMMLCLFLLFFILI